MLSAMQSSNKTVDLKKQPAGAHVSLPCPDEGETRQRKPNKRGSWERGLAGSTVGEALHFLPHCLFPPGTSGQ
jgi:hypothetical protein